MPDMERKPLEMTRFQNLTVNAADTQLPVGCAVCKITEKLLRCSRCKLIYYCGAEHQAAHRQQHKSACNEVKKTRDKFEHEEHVLRTNPSNDMFIPDDIFNTEVGYFWGIIETRNYMRARFFYADACLKIKTLDSVKTGYEHLIDMLRLCRSDNMGIRYMIPALLLRLGKDQECYDFVKWHQTTGQESNYDWGDMSLPFLDVVDADLFEPVDYLTRRYLQLSHVVAITLLKIKLLQSRFDYHYANHIGEKVPREILDSIKSHLVPTTISAENQERLSKLETIGDLHDLAVQIEDLYEAVDRANSHFWPTLLNPGHHLSVTPGPYSAGSVQEMQFVLRYSYDSWVECTGALDHLRENFIPE